MKRERFHKSPKAPDPPETLPRDYRARVAVPTATSRSETSVLAVQRIPRQLSRTADTTSRQLDYTVHREYCVPACGGLVVTVNAVSDSVNP